MTGDLPTAEGIDPSGRTIALLSFKITDPEARARPVEPGELDRSIWAGMSGAGVVTAEDLLVGVIRSHAPAEGGRSLTVTPLGAISTLHRALADRFWAALGVTITRRCRGCRTLLKPSTRSRSRNQVVVGTIPRQPLGYIPRDAVDRLAQAARIDRVAVVCTVTGQRGVGKTQVAAAYARQRITDGWGLVGWVNADTPDRLLTDLAAIAEALGVQDPDGDSAKSATRLKHT